MNHIHHGRQYFHHHIVHLHGQFHLHTKLNTNHLHMEQSIHHNYNFKSIFNPCIKKNIHHDQLYFHRHIIIVLLPFHLHKLLHMIHQCKVVPNHHKGNFKSMLKLGKQMNSHHGLQYYHHHIVLSPLYNHHHKVWNMIHYYKVRPSPSKDKFKCMFIFYKSMSIRLYL